LSEFVNIPTPPFGNIAPATGFLSAKNPNFLFRFSSLYFDKSMQASCLLFCKAIFIELKL
jgi:hypothetical protein